jgi:predicted ATPase
LTGVLQARLDNLPAADREVLQQASVVGRVFWNKVVEHMRNPETGTSGSSSLLVAGRLETLEKKELIFHREASAFAETPEYIFKHAILHDVTYESVLLRLRKVYHVQVAENLIELGGERVNEYAGRVGEHFELAEEWQRAAEWYLRAGIQAQEAYAPEAAVSYFQKALGFLKGQNGAEQIARKQEVSRRLGEVLNWLPRSATRETSAPRCRAPSRPRNWPGRRTRPSTWSRRCGPRVPPASGWASRRLCWNWAGRRWRLQPS